MENAVRADRHATMSEATRSLTITRVFDAPPQAVFRAWTDPAQLSRWMGPRMIIRCEVEELSLRPGGTYRLVMHDDAGQVHTVAGTYREIAPPASSKAGGRLVFTWAFEGCDGAEDQRGTETLITVTFRAIGEKTEMTLHQQGFLTEKSRDGHDHGWVGSLDKLAELLAATK